MVVPCLEEVAEEKEKLCTFVRCYRWRNDRLGVWGW